jgi:hypothetical protein
MSDLEIVGKGVPNVAPPFNVVSSSLALPREHLSLIANFAGIAAKLYSIPKF